MLCDYLSPQPPLTQASIVNSRKINDALLFSDCCPRQVAYKCGECSKIFNSQSTFKMHEKYHSGFKQCDTCQKKFLTEERLANVEQKEICGVKILSKIFFLPSSRFDARRRSSVGNWKLAKLTCIIYTSHWTHMFFGFVLNTYTIV